MKIQCRTRSPDHAARIFLLGCTAAAIGWGNMHLQSLLGDAEESIILSRGLNTTKTSTFFRCDLPYDDCRCRFLLNKSNNSETCISDMQLVGSRILPFVSFFLQIVLVREIFSFSADCPLVITNTLWIIALLIFIGIASCIYWSSCLHASITITLFCITGILCLFSLHTLELSESLFSSPHNNTIGAIDRSKKNHNVRIAWEELP